MRYFLDTEFNGFGNELISIALVGEDDRSFYAIVDCPEPQPWVAEHVIPFLEQCPVTPHRPKDKKELAYMLAEFINGDASPSLAIFADWSDDLRLFYGSLTFGDAAPRIRPFMTAIQQIDYREVTFVNECPHNAWWDAKTFKEGYMAIINASK